MIADMLPPGHSASDVIQVIDQTVTPHAQSVGRLEQDRRNHQSRGRRRQGDLRRHGDPRGRRPLLDLMAPTLTSPAGPRYAVSTPIDTSGLTNPAPQQVYQTERYGNFTYTIPHLLPNSPYVVRLDFAEIYWNAPNQRLFNVLIDGNPVLTSFDVFAQAGGKDKAIDRQFECLSTASGQIVIQFTSLVDNAKVSGIQVAPAPDLALGKPAFSSTIEGPSFTPAMAVDGNSGTRWSSGQWMQQSGTGWIYVNLGTPFQINEVRLNWETAYAVNYQIQVADDALNWVAIKAVSGNQAKGPVDFTGLSAIGRYVRIYCTQVSAGSDNYSLYDFQVFGTPASLAALQPGGALTTLATNTQTTSLGSMRRCPRPATA